MKKLYYNFGLVDVIGRQYIPNSYLETENGKFSRVGLMSELTEAEKFGAVDLGGKTVMPGMFNVHVHALSTPIHAPASLNHEDPAKFALRGLSHLQQHLKSGVTFVRDMNGRKQAEMGLRDAIREGIVLGPHYIVCRQCLCMTGGHGSNTGRECDGPVDCKKAAREQIKHGADFVKIMATGGVMSPGMNEDATQLDQDEMAAAIYEAHKAGKKTATHAHGATGIKNAVRAGIDSVEHGSYLDDEGIELMLERGTALVPTLSVDYFVFKYGKERGVAQYALDKAARAHEASVESFYKAFKAGVLIGVGTDAGTPFNPHFATYMEFVSMVEVGLSPMDALVAGTINSAKIADVDSWTGSISCGKSADFIVLEKNPIEDIWALKNVEQVYLGGTLVILPNVEYLPHLE